MLDILVYLAIAIVVYLGGKRTLKQLNKREGLMRLPTDLKKQLMTRFSLDPAAIAPIRYRTQGGRYAGQSVQYLGIYSPVPGRQLLVGQTSDGTNAVNGPMVFEAQQWSDGNCRLEDRRARQPAFSSQ